MPRADTGKWSDLAKRKDAGKPHIKYPPTIRTGIESKIVKRAFNDARTKEYKMLQGELDRIVEMVGGPSVFTMEMWDILSRMRLYLIDMNSMMIFLQQNTLEEWRDNVSAATMRKYSEAEKNVDRLIDKLLAMKPPGESEYETRMGEIQDEKTDP